jgi:hypothetical protein
VAREYYRGKYHCTINLLFDQFEISCMPTDNFCFYLQNRLIQTSQTGGQCYSDTSPCSIPCCYYSVHLLHGGLLLLKFLPCRSGRSGRFGSSLFSVVRPRLMFRRLLPQLGQLVLEGDQLVTEGPNLGLEVSHFLRRHFASRRG